jgi:hypothetical protein
LEKINPFVIYEIGKALQPIHTLEGDISPSANFWTFFSARDAMNSIIREEHIPLSTSRELARQVHEHIENIFRQFFGPHDSGGLSGLKIPDDTSPPIPWYIASQLKRSLRDFETVFREEMKDLSAYLVPKTGIYSTSHLVDEATNTFPANLRSCLPEKTLVDWKAAGKCLAFGLFTACAFHVARSVEGTLEEYFWKCGAVDKEKPNSWSSYINRLKEIKKSRGDTANSPTLPSERVIHDIERLKNDYRNPVMHPEVVIDGNNARVLFLLGESIITLMALEMSQSNNIAAQQNLALGLEEGSGD